LIFLNKREPPGKREGGRGESRGKLPALKEGKKRIGFSAEKRLISSKKGEGGGTRK